MSEEVEGTVKGMDCNGCARSVQSALEKLDNVESAEVLLSAEKARIRGNKLDVSAIKKAVEDIGYRIPGTKTENKGSEEGLEAIAQKSFRLFGLVFGAILLVVVAGEWFGLFQAVTEWVPFWAGALIVLVTGYPVLKQVVLAARKGLVTPHALMALGAATALVAENG